MTPVNRRVEMVELEAQSQERTQQEQRGGVDCLSEGQSDLEMWEDDSDGSCDSDVVVAVKAPLGLD